MESYHKRKRLLDEKYGKLIVVKPFNDERVVIASNRQQKLLKQLQDISDEEGLKKHMIHKMVYINIIINYLQQVLKTSPKTTLTIKNYHLMILYIKLKEVEMLMLIIEVIMK